jgi:hypothetical protein
MVLVTVNNFNNLELVFTVEGYGRMGLRKRDIIFSVSLIYIFCAFFSLLPFPLFCLSFILSEIYLIIVGSILFFFFFF